MAQVRYLTGELPYAVGGQKKWRGSKTRNREIMQAPRRDPIMKEKWKKFPGQW